MRGGCCSSFVNLLGGSDTAPQVAIMKYEIGCNCKEFVLPIVGGQFLFNDFQLARNPLREELGDP